MDSFKLVFTNPLLSGGVGLPAAGRGGHSVLSELAGLAKAALLA